MSGDHQSLGQFIRVVSAALLNELSNTLIFCSNNRSDTEGKSRQLRSYSRWAKVHLLKVLAITQWYYESRDPLDQIKVLDSSIKSRENEINARLDELFFIHQDLFSFRSRKYEIAVASNIFSKGRCYEIPAALLPPLDPKSNIDGLDERLNVLIWSKLSSEVLPDEIKPNIVVSKGILTISIKYKYELKLSLFTLSQDSNWNCVDFKMLTHSSHDEDFFGGFDSLSYQSDVCGILKTKYCTIENNVMTISRLHLFCIHSCQTIGLRLLYVQALNYCKVHSNGSMVADFQQHDDRFLLCVRFWKGKLPTDMFQYELRICHYRKPRKDHRSNLFCEMLAIVGQNDDGTYQYVACDASIGRAISVHDALVTGASFSRLWNQCMYVMARIKIYSFCLRCANSQEIVMLCSDNVSIEACDTRGTIGYLDSSAKLIIDVDYFTGSYRCHSSSLYDVRLQLKDIIPIFESEINDLSNEAIFSMILMSSVAMEDALFLRSNKYSFLDLKSSQLDLSKESTAIESLNNSSITSFPSIVSGVVAALLVSKMKNVVSLPYSPNYCQFLKSELEKSHIDIEKNSTVLVFEGDKYTSWKEYWMSFGAFPFAHPLFNRQRGIPKLNCVSYLPTPSIQNGIVDGLPPMVSSALFLDQSQRDEMEFLSHPNYLTFFIIVVDPSLKITFISCLNGGENQDYSMNIPPLLQLKVQLSTPLNMINSRQILLNSVSDHFSFIETKVKEYFGPSNTSFWMNFFQRNGSLKYLAHFPKIADQHSCIYIFSLPRDNSDICRCSIYIIDPIVWKCLFDKSQGKMLWDISIDDVRLLCSKQVMSYSCNLVLTKLADVESILVANSSLWTSSAIVNKVELAKALIQVERMLTISLWQMFAEDSFSLSNLSNVVISVKYDDLEDYLLSAFDSIVTIVMFLLASVNCSHVRLVSAVPNKSGSTAMLGSTKNGSLLKLEICINVVLGARGLIIPTKSIQATSPSYKNSVSLSVLNTDIQHLDVSLDDTISLFLNEEIVSSPTT